MKRPYLFLAGEYNVTMQAVFQLDEWQHTMTARKLVQTKDGLADGRFGFEIKGLIYFARTDSYELELDNLKIIKNSGVPCWPNVDVLMGLSDRHSVMAKCREAGLTTDWSLSVSRGEIINYLDETKLPMVIKYGQTHQGEGKYKLENTDESWANLPEWDGLATVEPFYEGLSVRVLIIGDRVFGVQYHNPNSWIKNSLGCDYDDWAPIDGIVAHAQRAANHFGLEIAGVDYVVEPSGVFHFLEINQFPGLHINDESVKVAKEFLVNKMKSISRGES